MSSNMWESKIPMPAAMEHSHLGMATDGRFIYILSGQFGSQCRRPTARNFVLDKHTQVLVAASPSSPSKVVATRLRRKITFVVSHKPLSSLQRLFELSSPQDFLAHTLDCPSIIVSEIVLAAQLWRGRLHVMGGSKEDRQQPAMEYWSISEFGCGLRWITLIFSLRQLFLTLYVV